MSGYGRGRGVSSGGLASRPTEYYWVSPASGTLVPTRRLPAGDGDGDFPLQFGFTGDDDWAMLEFHQGTADKRFHGADFGTVFQVGLDAAVDTGGSVRERSDMAALHASARWPDGLYDLRLRVELGLDNDNVTRDLAVFAMRAVSGGTDGGRDEYLDSASFGVRTKVSSDFNARGASAFPTVDLVMPDFRIETAEGAVDHGFYFAIGDDESRTWRWINNTKVALIRGWLRMERKG